MSALIRCRSRAALVSGLSVVGLTPLFNFTQDYNIPGVNVNLASSSQGNQSNPSFNKLSCLSLRACPRALIPIIIDQDLPVKVGI